MMKLRKITIAVAAALSVGVLYADMAMAQDAAQVDAQDNAITSFDVLKDGAETVLRIEFKRPLSAVPESFVVAQPARIAFDLPRVVNSSGSNVREFPNGDLKSVSAVAANGRTRLVLNLRAAATHTAKLDGNGLVVRLSSQSVAAEAPVKRFAEGNNGVTHSVSGFDFRRGPAGEGRVLVDLSDPSTGIDIKQQGQTLVVDFRKTTVAENLRRRMNVTDFATLVQNVSLSQNGDGTRMVIEPKGSWEYNAYQTDKRFVVEVKQRVAEASPTASMPGLGGNYTGEKLTLNFQNVDVRNLLNVIADFTKLNIVTADSVQGNLTVRLQDVPWDQALDIILATRGLDMRRKGNVIWVAPRDEIQAREKSALEAESAIAELEPTRTESFMLNYSNANEVAALLNNTAQRILSKRGSVVTDPRTNQLFVQDIAGKLEEVRAIIKKVDIPVRQVQIEARIVEASSSFGQSLGARLGFFNSRPTQIANGLDASFGGKYTQYVDPLPADTVGNPIGGGGGGLLTKVPQVNLPAAALGSGATPSNFAFTLFNSAATRFLTLELSAAEADGRGKIVSSPRVITSNQKKALIEQGTELPYQQASSSGATAVAFKKANLKLEVTPMITPDGNVIMSVDINKDAPGASTAAGFAIDTKHVQTDVLVENGGTVVIGGIYTQDERTDVDKVPVLGDLPALGNLFRSKTKRDNKTELLILLTPRILDDRLNVTK